MRKGLVMLLAAGATLMLAACSGQAESAAGGTTTGSTATGSTSAAADSTSVTTKEESGIIAVCLPMMDNPLMTSIVDAVKAAFPDKEVQVSSADNDANMQASQLQNYTTMGVDELVVMPVEASSVEGVLTDAVNAGIKVVVAGTKPADGAYTAMANVNQFMTGSYCAQMAKLWVDANYPDAAEGSIECAVLGSSLNEDSAQKTKGLYQFQEPYLKNVEGEYIDSSGNVVEEADRVENPAYCPKLKLVAETDAEMFQAGQTAMQNILTTNSNVRVVIAYAADGACGASQAIMDAGFSADELAAFGAFGTGAMEPEMEVLKASANGEGVLRGLVSFGGTDLPGDLARLAKNVMEGNFEKDTWDPIGIVYMKDGEAQWGTVQNNGAAQVIEDDCY